MNMRKAQEEKDEHKSEIIETFINDLSCKDIKLAKISLFFPFQIMVP